MKRLTHCLAATIAGLAMALPASGNDLVISGVVDGPLTGGTPKAIELYVINNIADLSAYGLGSANNGEGTDGEEFTFPAVAASAGQFIYLASDSSGFTTFFGFPPDYVDPAASINGDDAIELFFMGNVIDVFGDINVDGSGEPWDYLDGWAYRVSETGPDGTTFVLGNWTFSGPNALDNEASNSTAAIPFPIGTYFQGDDCNGNGTPDADEIAGDPSLDCNNDGVLDECQLTPATDCDDNGELDECQIADDPSLDCNADGILDACQIEGNDCNENGTLDECDIADMTSDDANMDGVPDECQVSGVVINEIHADPEELDGDANLDGTVNGGEDEFVEIYNNTGADLNMSGWTLSDSGSVRHVFPDGTIIPDQCVIVVFGGGCPGEANFPNVTVQIASTGFLGLNNDGDTVTIAEADTTPVTSVTYGAEGGSNASLTRVPEITGAFVNHFTQYGTRHSAGTQGDGSAFIGCPNDPPPADSDGDGVPDTIDNCELFNPCQEDCNEDGIGDVCNLDSGFFDDCNGNGVLDICEDLEDCDGNGTPDSCEIADDPSLDCNANGTLDSCELLQPGADCNENGELDECELNDDPSLDLNGNMLIDTCEVTPPAGVLINEIRIDQPGTDFDHYFELTGPPGTSLDGVSYIVIGDGPGGSGALEAVINLTGLTIPGDGLLLVTEDTFALGGGVDFVAASLNFENSDNVTHVLVANLNPTLPIDFDLDSDNDGTIDPGLWWTDVIDVVGLKENDEEDLLYADSLGGTTVGPDGIFVPGHVYRCSPDGTWTIGLFDPFSIDPPSADTPGAVNVACEAADCPGDSNGDLVVDLADLLDVISNWAGPGPAGDVNSDGVVDLADLLEVISNWGSSCL